MAQLIAYWLRTPLLVGAALVSGTGLLSMLHAHGSAPPPRRYATFTEAASGCRIHFNMPLPAYGNADLCKNHLCQTNFIAESKARLAGDHQTSMRELSKIIVRDCTHWQTAMTNRANSQIEHGDYTAAISTCTVIIAKHPENAFAYRNRGSARAKEGDYTGALIDYNQALAICPGYAYFIRDRAQLYCDFGFDEKAIDEARYLLHADLGESKVKGECEKIEATCLHRISCRRSSM